MTGFAGVPETIRISFVLATSHCRARPGAANTRLRAACVTAARLGGERLKPQHKLGVLPWYPVVSPGVAARF